MLIVPSNDAADKALDAPLSGGASRSIWRGRAGRLLARVLVILVTLFGLLALTFFMGRLLPADPVLAVTGPDAPRALYERVYRELGLDLPVWQQFASYVGNVLRGDLGVSTITARPIVSDLLQVLPATFELAFFALFVGVVFGIPLGVLAAVHRGTIIDHIARILGLIGSSVPSFWIGLMALLFFYAKLRWVAASGRVDIFYEGLVTPVTGMLLVDSILQGEWEIFQNAVRHIVLPGTLLGLFSVAFLSRMTRSFMLEQLSQEYIISARAKGLSNNKVVWRHAFRNIRVQLLTIVALAFGGMLDGAVLIETVFAWPGMGGYLTRGLQLNDMNVVMGSVLFIGVMFLIINIITDALYRVLDPRTR